MIGVLIFPDFQLLDAAGPISAFEIAARVAGAPLAIKTLAVTPGPVRSSSGVEMLARGVRPSGAITTLIVAGGEGSRAAAKCEKTQAFVRAMAKRLNISTDAVATIGDMANDLAMFGVSGLSIAMGNATEEVKKMATHVTASNEDDGFAKAIDMILKQNEGRGAER